MREILFKAKRIDNGEWVEGCLVTRKYYGTDKVFEAHIVIDAYEQIGIMNFGGQPVLISPVTHDDFEEGCFKVDINTICQYTGLYDSTKWEDLSEKEQRAFLDEGNLSHDWKGKKIWENDLIEVKKGKSHFISQIEWDDWCKGFMFQDTKTTACGMDALSGGGCYRFDYEVIGNVFDNPELVKGSENNGRFN